MESGKVSILENQVAQFQIPSEIAYPVDVVCCAGLWEARVVRIGHCDYDLDDDPARLDRDAVVSLLATADAYWERWRKPADVQVQIDGAWRVVGAYRRPDGAMVGFARAVSDGVAVAYLADVIVAPAARGIGLGAALVDAMIERGPGQGFRWMLHTKDAHPLYRKFGFAAPPSTYLERPSLRSQLPT